MSLMGRLLQALLHLIWPLQLFPGLTYASLVLDFIESQRLW